MLEIKCDVCGSHVAANGGKAVEVDFDGCKSHICRECIDASGLTKTTQGHIGDHAFERKRFDAAFARDIFIECIKGHMRVQELVDDTLSKIEE
jgi:ribosome-binding protein aMBF1 (putative translation factor)